MNATVSIRLSVVAACLAVSAVFLAPPAKAEDGAWRVGSSYVIRFQHLDLDRAADRQALLKQVERSASSLCKGHHTKARREACAETAVSSSLKSVPAQVKRAVETARLERDGEQQAQR
jgi:UrcA family protein